MSVAISKRKWNRRFRRYIIKPDGPTIYPLWRGGEVRTPHSHSLLETISNRIFMCKGDILSSYIEISTREKKLFTLTVYHTINFSQASPSYTDSTWQQYRLQCALWQSRHSESHPPMVLRTCQRPRSRSQTKCSSKFTLRA
jgi:hypothetical protein